MVSYIYDTIIHRPVRANDAIAFMTGGWVEGRETITGGAGFL